jgi:hypothetical protein
VIGVKHTNDRTEFTYKILCVQSPVMVRILDSNSEVCAEEAERTKFSKDSTSMLKLSENIIMKCKLITRH